MNQIELQIFDRSYKLACEPKDAEALRAAAKYLDGKLRSARSAMPRLESDRLAVMVALEICQELLQVNKALQDQQACQRLVRQMIQDVQDAIDTE